MLFVLVELLVACRLSIHLLLECYCYYCYYKYYYYRDIIVIIIIIIIIIIIMIIVISLFFLYNFIPCGLHSSGPYKQNYTSNGASKQLDAITFTSLYIKEFVYIYILVCLCMYAYMYFVCISM